MLNETPAGTVKIANPQKLQDVATVYKTVKANLEEKNAKVSYKLYSPFLGSASVKIIGKNILLKHPEKVFKAAKLASNFEVYPRTDGKVCMAFTFDGLVETIS